MKNRDKVYLTFSIDKETHDIIKWIAHKANVTQTELINDVLKNFIKSLFKDINNTDT